ncbi:DUF3021 domain-containing protein [Enterococcus sp. JM4C]|uniref:DUF3021 family protein n=1 Tax=Candidatus Enterococcus huntleyi TaxID=1857217 RepID=UPI00137B4803|nr:DUF3021 family protein [Enterococcus sp. JM4C]KAF1299588.1 DUF3021 domain-containing protein [Enterococcus sp. JM4C]
MKQYIRKAISIMSLVFTILVVVSLLIDKDVLLNIVEFMLGVSAISGLLIFLVQDNESYSNSRVIMNQIIYIALIFAMVVLGDIFYKWDLGWLRLGFIFLLILAIYFFIKLFMYGRDKREADEINKYIQEKKSK